MMAGALDDGLMHDGNAGVSCPTCGAPAGAADSFCESCGTELTPPVSSPVLGKTYCALPLSAVREISLSKFVDSGHRISCRLASMKW